jgi:hypothetical protein
VRKDVLACLLLVVKFTTCHPCLAEESSSQPIIRDTVTFNQERKDLFEIDRKIVLELIKLSRFNLTFRLRANYHWAGRAWLYPLAQECGTGAVFANNVLDLSQRARGLDNPSLISAPSRKRGLESAIAGAAVNGASSFAELAQNTYVAWDARRQGFSPRRSVAFVKQSVRTIDDLLSRRAAILGAEATTETNSLASLEGRLLKHIRNQLLFQFKTWSIASREAEWRENTFYAIDSVREFTSSTSSIVSLKAFSDRQAAGGAAITSVVANALATLNPSIRDLAALAMRKHQDHKLSKIFSENRPRTIEELRGEWDDLDHFLSGNIDSADKRTLSDIAGLIRNSRFIDNTLSTEEKRIQRLRRVAAQQTISGTLIGLTGLARSIGNTVSYYDYRSNPIVGNRINFAGQISQTSGQFISLVVTPKTAIMHAIYRNRLAKAGQLPSQILSARLARLDQIEAAIKSSKP